MMCFARKLRELRKIAGLTQIQLAWRAQLSVSLVTKLEQGNIKDPKWSTVRKLATVLGVKTDVFVPEK